MLKRKCRVITGIDLCPPKSTELMTDCWAKGGSANESDRLQRSNLHTSLFHASEYCSKLNINGHETLRRGERVTHSLLFHSGVLRHGRESCKSLQQFDLYLNSDSLAIIVDISTHSPRTIQRLKHSVDHFRKRPHTQAKCKIAPKTE